MRSVKGKVILLLLGGVLALGLLGLASIVGPGSSEAQEDIMLNCPQASKWAISVWSGDDDTDTAEALATCAQGVAYAYYIDPDTQGWLRWFAARQDPDVSNLRMLDHLQAVLAYGAMAPPPPPPTPTVEATPTPTVEPTPTAEVSPTPSPTVMPSATWTGVWDTNWGNMELTQSDSSVTGTYVYDEGQIQGTVQGNKLIGTWSESPSYAPPDDAGEFEFTMSPDGNSFLGRWRYDSSGDWSEWSATRIS
ncbi:MAG: hypothetical protein AMJ77_06920 [Dehalococcoidia bacterium SM23_28_2]|nr:MAG: hypothetical protein AMJ77_06920 [Dehalococcoidia bacterium SM23_28_2]